MAARPRTLPAAVAPVLVGTALAIHDDEFHALAFVAALLGAILIQVGTNLSNDYSDARRGADTEDRLGPGARHRRRARAAAAGARRDLRDVRRWRCSSGSTSSTSPGPELLLVGAASILAGVLYTGGPRPYGYEGLGEVFVFTFFGIVAVTGSYYVQAEELPWEAFVLAVPVGLLAAAILVVNNVRDLETDRRAGKRTLAVRLGRERTRTLYAVMLVGAYAVLVAAGVRDRAVGAARRCSPLPLAVRARARPSRTHTDGPTLNEALAGTGMLQLVFCVLLSAGILLS